VFDYVEFNVADGWKTIGYFFKDLVGNPARLAKL
jgi:hypothetical protein